VTSSAGNGVIYDPKTFDWGDDKFKMATGNELVIYEMHIGTFNVKKEGGRARSIVPLKNFLTSRNWASMPLK